MNPSALFGFFAAPLAGLLATAGALAGAVAIPIVIHLLNRKRFRVVTWAAMRFLLAAQRKNARKLRLEQLLLLAVRVAVVALLVLAMACVMPWVDLWVWPRLFPNGTAFARDAGQARTHKILVVDGSFSMALRVGDGSCFDRARAVAEQIVQESPRGDSFSVLLMAAPPRRVVSEPSEDPGKVVAELKNLRLPHGNADVLATLNAVENLLRQSPGKFQEREVYFVTDLQKSTWVDGAGAGKEGQSQSTFTEVLQKIQGRARTVFVDVGQDTPGNVAVTNLVLGASPATPATQTPVVATLTNYGSEPRNQVRAELLVGRARANAADPPFELRVVQQQVVPLARGQNTVSFSYKFPAPGDYVVQVRTENDALELDDVRSAVVSVRGSVPVLLVNGKLVEGRPTGVRLADEATEWLRLALNPYSDAAPHGGIIAQPKVVTENEFNDAGAGDLTPYDCVFLCDVKQFTPAEVRRLETHLRRGGGAVFCLGPHVDLGAYNDLLSKNGTGILPANLKGKRVAEADTYWLLGADERSFQLPPLAAFADDNDRVALLQLPRFWQYVQAELPPAARGARKVLSFVPPPDRDAKSAEVLKKFKRMPVGEPAVVEWQPPFPPARDDGPLHPARMRGRVVLFTTPVNADWSTLPPAPSFVPLMNEVLDFAVSGRLREQAVTVGEPLEEFLPTAGSGLDVAFHTPDGRAETVHTQAYDEASVFRWADTDQSGLYRATVGQHPQEHYFAVNVPTSGDGQSASESDPTRTGADELHKVYPDWDFQVVTDPHAVTHTGGPAVNPEAAPTRSPGTVFARWLLLGMLALVLVEVVLAWVFGHYSAVAGAPGGPPARGRLLPAAVGAVAGVAVLAIGGVLLQAAWSGDFLNFCPDWARRGAEQLLGIAAPAPGEGSRWRLEFNPFLWDAAADPWLAGLAAVVAAGLVGWVYFREGRTAGAAYRFLLAGLRVGLVLLTLAVLLPELRLWFERQGWPDVALLIDDSASMSTVDQYQDPQVQSAASQIAADAGLTNPERLALAKALVANPKNDWITQLLTRHKVKVHVYHCSGRAQRLHPDVASADDIEPVLAQVRDFRAEPSHDSSQLGTAVRQVINDFRGSSLAAVVMLTDGVTTEGEDLVKVSHYASQYGVPLYFVGLGDDHERRDVALHDLQAEESVYVNDQVVFELRLTGHGYPNLSVPVELYEKGKEQPQDRLDQQQVTVDPQGKPVKVRLRHRPTEVGEKHYVIKTPVQEGEATADNNKLERAVEVQDTRLFRVLYVEGYPRYEYRFVKTLLERESARKGNKTIDLKVLLLDADPDYAAEDRSAVAEFPLKTDLNKFDVIVLGDVDPKHPRLGDKNVQALADFVKERGGGLLMVAGERYSPWVWRNTPLADVLPIEVTRDQAPEEPEGGRPDSYRPELTPMGRLHPIFRFSPDEQANEEIWGRLREMYWYADGYRVKPAAEVLAVHPRAQGEKAPARGGVEGLPLVVQQFVGSGRCMFFGFCETWRWRYREDELHFNQFWIQTVRYLARSRLGKIELRVDRQTPYRRGEAIKLTVRFPDDAAPPGPETKVEVFKKRRPPRQAGVPEDRARNVPPLETEKVQLARVEGSRSTFEALVTRTPEGEYTFTLIEPTVKGPKPRAECRVLAPPGEMELLRMNQPDLERAAEESHGRFYTLADAGRLLGDLPAGTRVTLNASGPPLVLWNQFAVFGLALFFLTAEWVLRKRKHLL